MPTSDPLIDLQRVRRNFARRASVTGSLGDWLAREIGQRMLERLLCIKLDPQVLLDAGSGHGHSLEALRAHYPQAGAMALDHCLPMLQHAALRQQNTQTIWQALWARLSGLPWAGSRTLASRLTQRVVADFAQLPLSPVSLDLVWSNLALHWHPEPAQVFAEWGRVLRPEGLVMFSCLGPDTFKQVRQALGQDAASRVMPFIDMHDLGDQLVRHGFGDPVMDMEQLTLTYATPQQLLREVAALGGNPLYAQPRGVLARSTYHGWLAALQTLAAAEGRIPLTIEVIYGHAWKPPAQSAKKQPRTPEGHVIIPLDQLRPRQSR